LKEPKLAIWIAVLLLVVALVGCIEENHQVQSNIIYVDDNGSANYKNIQDAINAYPDNYTIFVYSGIYYENIVINKTINLMGEDAATTIIDGNDTGDVIYIFEGGKANISGFTIKKSGINAAGISIHSNNNTISGNNISDNSYGIFSSYSQYNNFSQNTLLSNSAYGMYLNSVSDSVIFDNVFSFNSCGLRIKGSKNNEVFRNLFTDNQKGMYFCCSARYNIVFFNVFSNNSIWNADDSVGSNQWDNENIGIGNYWDDYGGTDADGDGIGDTPYTISSNGQDNYPLIDKEGNDGFDLRTPL
jgi:nitrous oxidase accessory protein